MGTDDRHISFDTNCLSHPASLAAVSFKYLRVLDLRPFPQDTLHSLHSEYLETTHSAKITKKEKPISKNLTVKRASLIFALPKEKTTHSVSLVYTRVTKAGLARRDR